MIIIVILGLFFIGLSILQFLEKGPLLNNASIWNSNKGRNKLNKKKHYRQSAICFLLIGLTHFAYYFYFINGSPFLGYTAMMLVGSSILYAIFSSLGDMLKK